MLTGTYGPGNGAVWDVTPGSVAFLAGGEAFCRTPAASHRVTAWQLNTARLGGRRAATQARPAPAAGGAGPARPNRPCDRRR